MTLADDRARSEHVPTPGTPPETAATGFSLDDRYTRESGDIYLTGIQALVRMVRDRARVDRRTSS